MPGQSSPSSLDGAGGLDYVTLASDDRIYAIFFLIGITILVYDYFLTFQTEVKYIWSVKLRSSAYWFLAVRYFGLGASITMSVFFFREMGTEVCLRMQLAWQALLVIQEVLIDVTLGMRVLAMYGFKFWVLLCLLGAGSLTVGLAIWAVIDYGHPQVLSAPGLVGCHIAVSRANSLRLAGAWEAQLFCDTLLVALTLRRAYLARHTLGLYRGSLIERMVADGGMYFVFLVLANVANLLTFYLGDILLSGFLSWFTTSLSVTLLSRLMLNLHESADAVAYVADQHRPMDLELMRFRTVPTMEGFSVDP
ncbi:hypothetical protein FB45DRAFT_898452 [Roridomyces roridus]|uniref:DUF6533 domain-containing protein n=1 Tax=Roridomyces roridus TaxID=1738132 RepID=A0AAD7CE90_9AGAR|nr:hypothetical protein FB45DRAFT_898452 [Roridomyces roridus]